MFVVNVLYIVKLSTQQNSTCVHHSKIVVYDSLLWKAKSSRQVLSSSYTSNTPQRKSEWHLGSMSCNNVILYANNSGIHQRTYNERPNRLELYAAVLCLPSKKQTIDPNTIQAWISLTPVAVHYLACPVLTIVQSHETFMTYVRQKRSRECTSNWIRPRSMLSACLIFVMTY